MDETSFETVEEAVRALKILHDKDLEKAQHQAHWLWEGQVIADKHKEYESDVALDEPELGGWRLHRYIVARTSTPDIVVKQDDLLLNEIY